MTSKTEARTILIVEDEPNIMKFASKVLELEGYQICQAWDANEGLGLVKESHIDLVLLDLTLPGTDGWEVLRQLKDDPELSKIPVVVFTAAVELPNQERASSMGAADFLMKPLSPATLRESIHSILHHENGV
ncbi:MAG: response regulator [Chloroflexi bacterium]|mgnify:CR=1 FL=1|jgi:CheY-like chemotaxis protein|nr:response regulator [Chloroflexota bacterium]